MKKVCRKLLGCTEEVAVENSIISCIVFLVAAVVALLGTPLTISQYQAGHDIAGIGSVVFGIVATLGILAFTILAEGRNLLPNQGLELVREIDKELNTITSLLLGDELKNDITAQETLPLLTKRRNDLVTSLRDFRKQQKRTPETPLPIPDFTHILQETILAREALEVLKEERSKAFDVHNLRSGSTDIISHVRTLTEEAALTRGARSGLHD